MTRKSQSRPALFSARIAFFSTTELRSSPLLELEAKCNFERARFVTQLHREAFAATKRHTPRSGVIYRHEVLEISR
jgi:hypothetical protein